MLSLLNNELIVKGISEDRYIEGKSIIPINSINYLIIDNIPSPTFKQNPTQEQFTSCFFYAEKVFWSAKLDDWEAFGINLDKCYSREREILETNIKCDLAYTTARTVGAWGGYSSENKLFLVCPAEKVNIIKEAVEGAIRTIG